MQLEMFDLRIVRLLSEQYVLMYNKQLILSSSRCLVGICLMYSKSWLSFVFIKSLSLSFIVIFVSRIQVCCHHV